MHFSALLYTASAFRTNNCQFYLTATIPRAIHVTVMDWDKTLANFQIVYRAVMYFMSLQNALYDQEPATIFIAATRYDRYGKHSFEYNANKSS